MKMLKMPHLSKNNIWMAIGAVLIAAGIIFGGLNAFNAWLNSHGQKVQAHRQIAVSPRLELLTVHGRRQHAAEEQRQRRDRSAGRARAPRLQRETQRPMRA